MSSVGRLKDSDDIGRAMGLLVTTCHEDLDGGIDVCDEARVGMFRLEFAVNGEFSLPGPIMILFS